MLASRMRYFFYLISKITWRENGIKKSVNVKTDFDFYL